MIDLEGYVFDKVATAARTQFAGIEVKAEYDPTASVLPCVTIEQKDNFVSAENISGDAIENVASVMFEVNVYTNDGATRKKTAKSIMSFIDDKMSEIGFVRTMLQPIPNLLDATIFRYAARYSAKITQRGEDYVVYTK